MAALNLPPRSPSVAIMVPAEVISYSLPQPGTVVIVQCPLITPSMPGCRWAWEETSQLVPSEMSQVGPREQQRADCIPQGTEGQTGRWVLKFISGDYFLPFKDEA